MMKVDHLLGIPFEYGKQDCLTCLRNFYQDNFNLAIPNYARPIQFWDAGLDLYREKAWSNGFRPIDVHPSELIAGDLCLIAISAVISNHAAMIVDGGKILHHVVGNLSRVEAYTGSWRYRTIGIYRHPYVFEQYKPEKTVIDFMELKNA